MEFVVKLKDRNAPKLVAFPHVILEQDLWDDYGYRTTFNATLYLGLGKDEAIALGSIKILSRTQRSGDTPMPVGSFDRLAATYCSLGADLKYYKTLFKLGDEVYKAYLIGIRDVAYNDLIKARFEDLEGYRVSLMRFSGAERTIEDARRIFTKKTISNQRRLSAGFQFKFKTRVSADAEPFIVDFDFRRRSSLPSRMNVVIGYNGTGKTRLLSNLAIVTSGYGYTSKEEMMAREAGRFVGRVLPPFKSVVVVSYSAFDTFVIPGIDEVEKRRLKSEGDLFGYVYCGLRELTRGSSTSIKRTYRLRTPQEIEDEFLVAIGRVREAEREDVLEEVIRPLTREASFLRMGLRSTFIEDTDRQIRIFFNALSSGHKIALKIATELTAHMSEQAPTLVLIDEPETHLHPPLLAALLKSIRTCLDRLNGYAVVATHSPVVLQETPARFVRVVRRQADGNSVGKIDQETFGENIGLITQEIFNLDDGTTNWHETLRTLAQTHSIEEIEELIERRLGFSARSYVRSVFEDERG